MVAEAAVVAAANFRSYPWSVMALISICPRPTASETAEPVMPAKIMLPMILTWASPPLTCPMSTLQKV